MDNYIWLPIFTGRSVGATFRVFGCPPGTYGAGVSELVESKNWKTQEDLGNNYIRYSSHAYGEGSYGSQKPAAFRTVLSRMDVTVKNEDSREYDMMSCTDYYNYYGGLIVANKTVRGKLPFSLVEAISRGMWQTDKNMEDRLRGEYLEIEGEIEELS